jgi:hypothetical protein
VIVEDRYWYLLSYRAYVLSHPESAKWNKSSILIVICNESCRKDSKDGRSCISIKIQPLHLLKPRDRVYLVTLFWSMRWIVICSSFWVSALEMCLLYCLVWNSLLSLRCRRMFITVYNQLVDKHHHVLDFFHSNHLIDWSALQLLLSLLTTVKHEDFGHWRSWIHRLSLGR